MQTFLAFGRYNCAVRYGEGKTGKHQNQSKRGIITMRERNVVLFPPVSMAGQDNIRGRQKMTNIRVDDRLEAMAMMRPNTCSQEVVTIPPVDGIFEEKKKKEKQPITTFFDCYEAMETRCKSFMSCTICIGSCRSSMTANEAVRVVSFADSIGRASHLTVDNSQFFYLSPEFPFAKYNITAL
ncbi:hypothetical protein BDV34DRAFT_149971 [Aspergillus parasiticus]|uniref:Uncharacterized protein n=1 Tax=Aspergillus parasiticus TaxID=5067 RepID=A0A5N6DB72_ASPPA|nr:hypothetical protein BDV34DRAFT_149971 [Aspergillus parasiticus]